jgi:acyl-homoserine-lactone acylase
MIKITSLNRRLGTLLLAAGLSACGSDNDVADNQVNIRYTDYGVPHIKANDYYGVSYGQGYAHAQENMCTLAEQIVAVRSERAKVFGSGDGDTNITEDVGVLALGVYADAQATFDNLTQEHKTVINGYVDGFNFAVAEKGNASNYPSPCRDADWIPTLTNIDLHAYHLRLALLSSGDAVDGDVARAAPPQQVLSNRSLDLSHITKEVHKIGSNGWAIGKDRSESGKGMLLSNPHFPWVGHLRFVQSHITIPGQLNMTGVGFVGVPGILIGFNDHIGWTHTVSQSKRMTIYQLTLNPENPMQYAYGQGEELGYRDITSRDFTILVKGDNDQLSEQTHTVYYSHYGPIMNWLSASVALTYRDANAGNTNIVPQWLAMNRATTLDEFQTAYENHQGIPWVNTMATDADGNVFYIDGARTANLHPQAEAQLTPLLTTPLAQLQAAESAELMPAGTTAIATQLQAQWQEGRGQLVLDGSNPAFEWITDASTPVSGVAPFSKAPKSTRTDYVFNANSSHWLTNVSNPLEGYSIVYGPEQTIRSPRTRMNALQLTETSVNGASGADGKFSLNELKAVMTSQRGMSSELLKESVATRCAGKQDITVSEEQVVDISNICQAITLWDGRYYNESVGAHVFREFLNQFKTNTERALHESLFENKFDVTQPVTTPNTLAPRSNEDTDDSDPILLGLAQAQLTLNDLGFALDKKLGELQFHQKNETFYPIPGGQTVEGVFNINAAATVPNVGYGVYHGASWVMALEFTDEGPKADAWLTYGQSHDPESVHYDDQTALYSSGTWRPVVFSEDDIQANIISELTLTLE